MIDALSLGEIIMLRKIKKIKNALQNAAQKLSYKELEELKNKLEKKYKVRIHFIWIEDVIQDILEEKQIYRMFAILRFYGIEIEIRIHITTNQDSEKLYKDTILYKEE